MLRCPRLFLLVPCSALLLASGCKSTPTGAGDTSKTAKPAAATAAQPTNRPATAGDKPAPVDLALSTEKVCARVDAFTQMESEACGDCIDAETEEGPTKCGKLNDRLLKCVGGDEAYGKCSQKCDDDCDKETSKCCECRASCFEAKDKKCLPKYLALQNCWLVACADACQ